MGKTFDNGKEKIFKEKLIAAGISEEIVEKMIKAITIDYAIIYLDHPEMEMNQAEFIDMRDTKNGKVRISDFPSGNLENFYVEGTVFDIILFLSDNGWITKAKGTRFGDKYYEYVEIESKYVDEENNFFSELLKVFPKVD